MVISRKNSSLFSLFLLVSVVFGVPCLNAQQAPALSQASIPEMSDVFARLSAQARQVRSVPGVAELSAVNAVYASYRLIQEDIVVELWWIAADQSSAAKALSFTPSPLKCLDLPGVTQEARGISSRLELRREGTSIRWRLVRPDGSVFLFLTRDQSFDACRFFARFVDCFVFFENLLRTQARVEHFPALLGTLPLRTTRTGM